MENLEDFGNSEAEYDEVLSDVIKNNENIQN